MAKKISKVTFTDKPDQSEVIVNWQGMDGFASVPEEIRNQWVREAILSGLSDSNHYLWNGDSIVVIGAPHPGGNRFIFDAKIQRMATVKV